LLDVVECGCGFLGDVTLATRIKKIKKKEKKKRKRNWNLATGG
jgi:hypothetical protein